MQGPQSLPTSTLTSSPSSVSSASGRAADTPRNGGDGGRENTSRTRTADVEVFELSFDGNSPSMEALLKSDERVFVVSVLGHANEFLLDLFGDQSAVSRMFATRQGTASEDVRHRRFFDAAAEGTSPHGRTVEDDAARTNETIRAVAVRPSFFRPASSSSSSSSSSSERGEEILESGFDAHAASGSFHYDRILFLDLGGGGSTIQGHANDSLTTREKVAFALRSSHLVLVNVFEAEAPQTLRQGQAGGGAAGAPAGGGVAPHGGDQDHGLYDVAAPWGFDSDKKLDGAAELLLREMMAVKEVGDFLCSIRCGVVDTRRVATTPQLPPTFLPLSRP